MSINGIKIEDVVREFVDDRASRHEDMKNALSYNSAREFQGNYAGSRIVTLEQYDKVQVGINAYIMMPTIAERDLYMWAY